MSLTLLAMMYACSPVSKDTGEQAPSGTDTATEVVAQPEENDTGEAFEEDPEEEPCTPPTYQPSSFINEVIEYNPGGGAGFGQDNFPDIVFGPPLGAGENAGSLDVLSLGEGGSITVAFGGVIQDGPGADIIVFENSFIGWVEPASLWASEDGTEWVEWPCDDDSGLGCAGITPVLSHPDNCIDATDPDVAGGDAFDLADVGLDQARYLRVVDSAVSGPGGFDLEAISIVGGAVAE